MCDVNATGRQCEKTSGNVASFSWYLYFLSILGVCVAIVSKPFAYSTGIFFTAESGFFLGGNVKVGLLQDGCPFRVHNKQVSKL